MEIDEGEPSPPGPSPALGTLAITHSCGSDLLGRGCYQVWALGILVFIAITVAFSFLRT